MNKIETHNLVLNNLCDTLNPDYGYILQLTIVNKENKEVSFVIFSTLDKTLNHIKTWDLFLSEYKILGEIRCSSTWEMLKDKLKLEFFL